MEIFHIQVFVFGMVIVPGLFWFCCLFVFKNFCHHYKCVPLVGQSMQGFSQLGSQ